ncbi:MAG: nickel-dependent lactate racemase [Selenomonadales bacterium]|nr:nickel-dependent lactate racemase [Selenomonadales bacterium]
MAEIKVCYSKGHLTAVIPDEKLNAVLESKAHAFKPAAGESELVQQALENPIASPRLCELAKGKQNIVIIASDHTRPVPSKVIAPLMLAEIRKGNPDANITFLIATGFHRPTTKEELIAKFGEEIVANENIIVHDAFNDDDHVLVGMLPSGGQILLDKVAANADLLVSEGFIEPHFFAGFSGGRKSVLPGVVSAKTVMYNHNSEFINSEKARTGLLEGNPIHIDMLAAAKAAKLCFICNVVIDADKKVIAAFAGDLEAAHDEGTKFAGELAGVKAVPADIVITSNGGYPLDQNVYQTCKGMSAGEATCKPGGVIIIASACNDGHGGQAFYDWFAKYKVPRAVVSKILQIPRDATIADQWCAQITARILMNYTVIIISDQCDHGMLRDFGFIPVNTMEEAQALAEDIAGQEAKYTVIPDGVAVIVQA